MIEKLRKTALNYSNIAIASLIYIHSALKKKNASVRYHIQKENQKQAIKLLDVYTGVDFGEERGQV